VRPATAIAALCATASVAAAGQEFSLGLENIDLEPQDRRTEARLATWNSPMGRLMHQFHQQQSSTLRGSQPGGAAGITFGLRLWSGTAPTLSVATTDTGVEIYERWAEVVRWPWQEGGPEVLPMEVQISLLLGRRLESRVGSDQATAD